MTTFMLISILILRIGLLFLRMMMMIAQAFNIRMILMRLSMPPMMMPMMT